MKTLILSTVASCLPATMSSFCMATGSSPNKNALTYSLYFESNVCFTVFLRCLRKSEEGSRWGSYLSLAHLYLETSVKSSRAYSLRNICTTCLRVLSGVTRIVCHNSMASSRRKLVNNWSYCFPLIFF